MISRRLATDNEPLRADAFSRQAVGATTAFAETIKTPGTAGLISRAAEVGQAEVGAITREQMQSFMDANRDRKLRQRYLEDLLTNSTDERRKQDYRDELSSMAGEAKIAFDALTQEAIDEGRLVSAEELNKRYAGFLTFDRPTTELAARLMYDNKKEQVVRDAIIQSGPGGLSGIGIAVLGGIAVAATDPLDLASSFIPVVGQAGKAAAIARFGRIGGRAAVGATEGAIGAAITEPVYYGFSRQLQLDYTMSDALLNVGAGTFLGGGIGAAAGVITRRGVDVAEATRIAKPDIEVRTDLEPAPTVTQRPEIREKTQADISRQYQNAEAFNMMMNSRTSADLAIRQMVLDQGVDVSVVMPKVVKRPQTLVEFVRSKGGIADTLPGAEGRLAEIGFPPNAYVPPKQAARTTVANVNRPGSQSTLDTMAVQAQTAGYIKGSTPEDLLKALGQELGGEPVFSARNARKLKAWVKYSEAKSTADAEVRRRADIKRGANELGFSEITDGEIAVVSSVMARNGVDLERALEDVYAQTTRVSAKMAADVARRANQDPLANQRASEIADRVQDEFDLDGYIDRSTLAVEQMRLNGELTPDDEAALAELANLDQRTIAYGEVITAATICTARS